MTPDKNATGHPIRIKSGIIPSDANDETLAMQVARGNPAALELLYDRYSSIVMGIALKIIADQAVAEDILQETFWRVWQSAYTYQSQLGPFTGWLFRIARNLAIDAYRRQRLRPQIGLELRPPALGSALEHVRVMEQPIEKRGDRRRIAEEFAPVVDGPI